MHVDHEKEIDATPKKGIMNVLLFAKQNKIKIPN